MELQFSEIEVTDTTALTEVMTRAFDDDAQKHLGVEKHGPPGYDDGGFFRQWLFGQEASAGFKAVFDNQIVSSAIVWVFDSGENILGMIFVDPSCQDRGIGSRLWQFLEARIPDTKSWRLETPSFATKNHHFYEKCGFQRTDVKPEEGVDWDSWIYRKEMIPG